MPRKTIIIFTLKDYDQQIISDNLEYAVEIINTFRDSIYKPLTKSNLNNILRGVAPIPPYIQEIYNEPYEEYIRPFFEEIYPNKKEITNKTTLNKYYKKIIDYLIEKQIEELE
mgnify:CR=1 FL=1|tara:strand:- start:366 stop:704 length:339 start_codon:yes stop_codon:yes gene_type:complete